MAAHARARGLVVASLLAVVTASPVAAVSTVPAEQVALLDGATTLAAIVADVDGDDVRELVRLVPWEVNPGQQAVEVVSIVGGQPVSHGQQLVRRAATPDDTFAGRNPDENDLLPVGVREPIRLLAWRRDGREEVLVGSIGTAGLRRPCCFTLWHLRLAGGETALELIQDTVTSAAAVLVADLDADGTDELVLLETPNPALGTVIALVVLRWDGATFERTHATFDEALVGGPLLHLGDSDGRPGQEVGVVGQATRFDVVAPPLHRVSLDAAGEVVTETAQLPTPGDVVPIDGPDGGRLAIVSGQGVSLTSWPSGGSRLTVEATSLRGGSVLGTVGSGDDARLFLLRGGAVDVLDARLASQRGISSSVPATRFARSAWRPYAGPLRGGDGAGVEALIFGGRLIGPPSDDSQFAAAGFPVTSNIAALPARTPIGLFGPDRGWAAVANALALPTERRGGALRIGAGERATAVAVVPTDELMTPEADDGVLEPEIDGGLHDVARARPTLLTAGPMSAEVRGPPGTELRLSGQGTAVRDAIVGPEAVASIRLVGDATEGDDAFVARLLAVTPAGHGYAAVWDVRVRTGAPRLEASVPMAPLGFEVTIEGRTDPAAALLLDGEPVVVRDDGAFRAPVAAGLLPSDVRLEVIDQLGNANELTVSVVAVLDYRRLPWIPIVAIGTLAIAAVLFLRAPRAGGVRARPLDGTLEEIE